MSFVMLISALAGETTAWTPRKQKVVVAVNTSRTRNAVRTALGRCDVHFATPAECLAELERRPCDLLIVCLDGEHECGVELVRRTASLHPSTPILALVEAGNVSLAVRVMKAGATDCMETSVKAAALRSAILGLQERRRPGERNGDPRLTQTESLVLSHILEGRTSREVAERLHRSPRTIEIHRQAIMHKLGASGKVDLIKRAASLGFIALGDPRSAKGRMQSPGP